MDEQSPEPSHLATSETGLTKTTTPQLLLRGATVKEENPTHDQSPSSEEELPMIVWLKGDEPIVDDFCLDADQAMEKLGIKRSRLTQISGKELRVGRIKMGRYTRPMYRPQDIDHYLRWTRATASHQKSSDAIKQAAKALHEKTQELVKEMHEGLSSETLKIQDLLTDLKAQQKAEFLDYQNALFKQFESFRAGLIQASQQQFESLHARLDEQKSEIEKLNRQLLGLQTIHDCLKTLLTDSSQIEQKLEQSKQMMEKTTEAIQQLTQAESEAQRDLGKALRLIIQSMREMQSQYAATIKQLDASQQPTQHRQQLDTLKRKTNMLRQKARSRHGRYRLL